MISLENILITCVYALIFIVAVLDFFTDFTINNNTLFIWVALTYAMLLKSHKNVH